jgi:DNA (cytosine-5)-methyltransferase 1
VTAFNALGAGRDTLDVFDEFSGFGGSLDAMLKIPGLSGRFAANHNDYALAVSAANHPEVEHFCGDVQRHDVTKFVPCSIFWASPACPDWTTAKGVKRTFDRANAEQLPGLEDEIDEVAERSRLLMDEVHRYLEAQWLASQPVLAGVVENVIEVRKWHRYAAWRQQFHDLGYDTKLIAFNSMHARPVRARRAPQSRDRHYLAYWLKALGRTPDWDKWLRPYAWCPRCDKQVEAIQVWNRHGIDMGRYKAQYSYRCPNHACRGQIVEPVVDPASTAIDWTIPSLRIGDRKDPLAAKTMARIGIGAVKFGTPVLAPAGGTWREQATPVSEPMPTRTTRETDGLAVPPLMVPVEGRDGKEARPAHEPARTQTCRNETGLAVAPFVANLRGGGSMRNPTLADEPLQAVTASGNHHGLVTTPEMLVPYYSTGVAKPVTSPIGALSTKDRYGLGTGVVHVDPEHITRAVDQIEAIDKQIQALPKGKVRDEGRIPLDAEALRIASGMGLDEFEFRMLEPHEIAAAMGFDPDFKIPFGSKRARVRGLGNAVTGCTAEVIVSALIEAVTGEDLERSL